MNLIYELKYRGDACLIQMFIRMNSPHHAVYILLSIASHSRYDSFKQLKQDEKLLQLELKSASLESKGDIVIGLFCPFKRAAPSYSGLMRQERQMTVTWRLSKECQRAVKY